MDPVLEERLLAEAKEDWEAAEDAREKEDLEKQREAKEWTT